jgi:NDP-4-keto-2,6-dideoxyhexose 3-C-methyltransferase
MYHAIERCRICGNANLEVILDLGEMALTGVFPRSPTQPVERGPLRLVKCSGGPGACCHLVQLAHTYELGAMYGDNYGYRSGLNPSMVRHLRGKVERILGSASLRRGDLVLDIGSNDGTTLAAYPKDEFDLLGVDPTAGKFRAYYPAHVAVVADFFSAGRVRRELGNRRARVVTSFSMFYDLPAPMEFMSEVLDVLEEDGIWVSEQSYLPAMLAANSYDTVCHEHLEYYGLNQIKWMADRLDAKIVDVDFNDVNGGSFSVTIAKSRAPHPGDSRLGMLLKRERDLGLDGLEPFRVFADRASQNRDDVRTFLDRTRRSGAYVAGLGASTKGNVLLQYWGATPEEIRAIGEINPDKYGSFTPGTLIPISSEDEVFARRPDYLIVLPWHFRKHFENSPRYDGQPLVFPLPSLNAALSMSLPLPGK